MPDSFCIVPQVWRHVCPIIYDLNVVHYLSNRFTRIVIPKDLRIQGAGKDNVFIRGIFGTQCGFQCTPIVTQQPTKGTLDLFSYGWIYTPTLPRQVTDSDIIKYKLSLNSELSLEAAIHITFG